jgi:hypothetical protein
MTKSDLSKEVRNLLSGQEAQLSTLSPDELFDIRAGRLGEEELGKFLERLGGNPKALRAALDTCRFPEMHEDEHDHAMPHIDIERSWSRFQGMLKQGKGERGRFGDFRGRFPTLRIARVAALVALVLSLALLWALSDRHTKRGPQVNLAITELAPEESSVLRSQHPVLRHKESSGFVLVLGLSEVTDSTDHRVEILAADGKVLWQSSALRRVDGLLTLTVPAGFLAPGSYRILLEAPGRQHRKLLATYSLTIS